MLRYILPFVLFLILSVFLYRGLGRDTSTIASPLIGKPAPAFVLPLLHDASGKFSSSDMRGKVWLLNVWASWCGSCKEEHPILMDLSRRNLVPLVGLDYKDKPINGEGILKDAGDPYTLVASDEDGKVGFDFGVYGVPETYVIDKLGIIRYKLVGAVTPQNLQNTILPLVARLQAQ
jgi:cytochrome c biogenesis protein CcmG/thiol:disulfide interchange protein DsbE